MMLDDSGIETWLTGGDPILSADIVAQIGLWPVTQMNKPGFDGPDCIEPLVG